MMSDRVAEMAIDLLRSDCLTTTRKNLAARLTNGYGKRRSGILSEIDGNKQKSDRGKLRSPSLFLAVDNPLV
jgi:hypothetical protein